MRLPGARRLVLALLFVSGATLACHRSTPAEPAGPARGTVAAPAAQALDGRVTVRISWRGRVEPARAAHLKPAPAENAGGLQVTIEAPELESEGTDRTSEMAGDESDACEALPAELRTRTFAATVDDVIPTSDPMSVFTTSRDGPPHSTPYRTVVVEGPTIQEQVSPTTFLAIDGSGARSLAAANPSAVTVPWSGDFETCELRAPEASTLGCAARPDQIVRRSICHFTNALLTIRRR